MSKRIRLLLALAVFLGVLCFGTAMADSSGTYGTNITWTLSDSGVLRMNGEGDMGEYNILGKPWGTEIKEVIIGEGITSIGVNIFSECEQLASVSIPDSVTKIQGGAFNQCYSLTEISIPSTVTYIGSAAFSFSGLKHVVIPNGVTSIESQTFFGCSEMESISLPDGLTSIGYQAFWNCTSLQSVRIPDGVSYVGSGAFESCPAICYTSMNSIAAKALGNVAFSFRNPGDNCELRWDYWSDEDGWLLFCVGADEEATRVVVPEGVVRIWSHAFSGHSNLESIVLPDSLEMIDNAAFSGCTGLESIRIPDQTDYIGQQAFANCSNLSRITLPPNLPGIEILTFNNCTSLTDITIPQEVTSIDGYAFYNCSSLYSISFPEGLTDIGQYAFYNCSNLTEISLPQSVLNINDSFGPYSPVKYVYYAGTEEDRSGINLSANDLYNAFWICSDTLAVWINESNFPDANFREFISNKFDKDQNELLADSEITDVTSIYCYNESIADLTGIEFFTELTDLFCPGNLLTALDVSKNLRLTVLVCAMNQISSLDISNNINLAELDCYYNQLSSLDVSSNTQLVELHCDSNNLQSLDVSSNSQLVKLYCGNNILQSLDVSNNLKLEELRCDGNQLNSLDVSKNTMLNYLYCGSDNLSELDVHHNVLLERLFCEGNNISVLDISNIPALCALVDGNERETNGTYNNYYDEYDNDISLLRIDSDVTVIAGKNISEPVVEIIASGTCGNDLDWVLSKEGILRINGTGTMASHPWTDEPYRSSVQYVILPEGLANIPDSGFSGCSQLKNIIIPVSIAGIGQSAFEGCDSLVHVYYAGTEEEWNAVSISDGNASLADAAIHFGSAEPVVIGSGSCGDNLTWMVTSDGVLAITGTGDMEISESTPPWGTSILTAEISEGVTSIDDFAFNRCSNLTEIVIPDSVTRIGNYAFMQCQGLTGITIPGNVVQIGNYAFAQCQGLTGITIPENVNQMGIHPFMDCTNLSSVNVAENNAAFSSVDGVMYNKDQTILLFCPAGRTGEVIIPDTVTVIEDRAFAGCIGLTGVLLPDSVTSIGYYAFESCSGLTGITIPENVNAIGESAFGSCTSLASINAAENNTAYSSIDGVLYNKNQTTLITCPAGRTRELAVPETVTVIGDSAFEHCKLTGILLPDSVTTIGSLAFLDCDSLTEITIPDSVTSIGEEAFYDCNNLASVVIPNSVNDLGDAAFAYCSSLEEIVIPNSIGKIEAWLFQGCISLSSITIPHTVTSVGQQAFGVCMSLADVYYTGTEEQWNEISISGGNDSLTGAEIHYNSSGPEFPREGICGDHLTWVLDDSGILTISGSGAMYDYGLWDDTQAWRPAKKLVREVIIEPGVTSIGDFAFGQCALTGISIPDTVTSIGFVAFYNCENLTSISLPGGLTHIASWIFGSCPNLTSVTMPDGVTDIGEYAFYGCGRLNVISLPKTVTTIDYRAFDATGLTDVYFAGTQEQWNSITIGDENDPLLNAVKHYLNTLILPAGLKVVEAEAFAGSACEAVMIPSGCTTICSRAFADCPNLVYVSIPASVISIADDAFEGCSENLVIDRAN